jgi:hypothetical protein
LLCYFPLVLYPKTTVCKVSDQQWNPEQSEHEARIRDVHLADERHQTTSSTSLSLGGLRFPVTLR